MTNSTDSDISNPHTGNAARGPSASTDRRLDVLAGMLAGAAQVLGEVKPEHLELPTPCSEFDVAALCQHMAVWIQVFDATVNDVALGFDPEAERIEQGWPKIVDAAGQSIVAALRSNGHERTMNMAGSPLPGEMVLNMLLMEYLGHSWDLTRACDLKWPFGDDEVEVALVAAEAIVQPEHRHSPMFADMVHVGPDAGVVDRFVAFIGRDPQWRIGNID